MVIHLVIAIEKYPPLGERGAATATVAAPVLTSLRYLSINFLVFGSLVPNGDICIQDLNMHSMAKSFGISRVVG